MPTTINVTRPNAVTATSEIGNHKTTNEINAIGYIDKAQ